MTKDFYTHKNPLKSIPFIFLDLLFQSNCRVCSLTICNMHKHNALWYQHLFLYSTIRMYLCLCKLYSTFVMNTFWSVYGRFEIVHAWNYECCLRIELVKLLKAWIWKELGWLCWKCFKVGHFKNENTYSLNFYFLHQNLPKFTPKIHNIHPLFSSTSIPMQNKKKSNREKLLITLTFWIE